jgi:hypothetical protein
LPTSFKIPMKKFIGIFVFQSAARNLQKLWKTKRPQRFALGILTAVVVFEGTTQLIPSNLFQY